MSLVVSSHVCNNSRTIQRPWFLQDVLHLAAKSVLVTLLGFITLTSNFQTFCCVRTHQTFTSAYE